MDWKSAKPLGSLPVNTMAIQPNTLSSHAMCCKISKMMTCGISSSQCTSGRQLAIRSGDSTVTEAG